MTPWRLVRILASLMVSRPARLAAASILILLALMAACTIIFMPHGGINMSPKPRFDPMPQLDLRLDQVAPTKAPEAALAIAAVAVPFRGEVMIRAGVQVAAPRPHLTPPPGCSQLGLLARYPISCGAQEPGHSGPKSRARTHKL